MKVKKFVSGIVIFACGMAASAAVIYSHGGINEARAESNCTSESLASYAHDGTPPDVKVLVGYNIPLCMKEMGYTLTKSQVLDGRVAVEYTKNQ